MLSMMDDWWNEFLPCGIVKSFHCHWRGPWRGLINERASVRNALLYPAVALISPPRLQQGVLITVKFKKKTTKNGKHGQWEPRKINASRGWTEPTPVAANAMRGRRPRRDEGAPSYVARVLPGWHAAVMNVSPPSGFSTCNKYLHSCSTSLTKQALLSHQKHPRRRRGCSILSIMRQQRCTNRCTGTCRIGVLPLRLFKWFHYVTQPID